MIRLRRITTGAAVAVRHGLRTDSGDPSGDPHPTNPILSILFVSIRFGEWTGGRPLALDKGEM